MNYTRFVGESEQAYIFRVCSDYEQIGTWQKVANIINAELGFTYTEKKYRIQYQNWVSSNAPIITDHREDLEYKERVKNNDKIRELRNDLRQEAREEYFWELAVSAIEKLKPLKLPTFKFDKIENDSSPLLLVADEHYGVEFQIKGLLEGEVLNEYNPEMFESRMWSLLNKVILLLEKEHYKQLNTFFLGDSLDGILRLSQLMSLRYGVIDSCMYYSEFLTNWLNELSKYVFIDYYSTFGNHTMLRLLDGKKNSFPNENMQKVIDKFVELRTENNPNIKVHRNNTEKIFTNIQGFNVLGVHGEEKSAEQALKDYSNIYGKNISYLLFGHKHHPYWEGTGFSKGVIGAGSIMGVDDFAMSIKAASNPCANYCIFEKVQGKVQENLINL